jgi:hypothetical protein
MERPPVPGPQERVESLERGGHHHQPGDSDTSDLSPLADSWRTRQGLTVLPHPLLGTGSGSRGHI